MSFTAFGELITELGDIAEAVIRALSEHTLVDRTTTKTETDPEGKRKHGFTTTKTTTYHLTAFDFLFIMVVTGIWTPFRDAAGNLGLKWLDVQKFKQGPWPELLGEDWAQGPIWEILEEFGILDEITEEAADEVVDFFESIIDPFDVVPDVDVEDVEDIVEALEDILDPLDVFPDTDPETRETIIKKLKEFFDPFDLFG